MISEMFKSWRCAPLLVLFEIGCQATATGRIKATGAVKTNADGAVSVEAKAEAEAEAEEPAGNEAVSFDKEKKVVKYDDDSKGEIKFKYNSDEFDGEDSTRILDGVVKFLKTYPEVTVAIEGHTDSRGEPSYNLELSKKRAAKIREYIVGKGIDGKRLSSVGRGEDDAGPIEQKVTGCFNQLPKDLSACEDIWRESRKAVFRVTSGQETIKKPTVVKKSTHPPKEEAAEPEPSPAPRRVWFLEGHVGYARVGGEIAKTVSIENYFNGAVPIGIGVGYWLTQNWALGASLDVVPMLTNGTEIAGCLKCDKAALGTRIQGYLEGHSSTGPGPSAWFALGLGHEGLSINVTPNGALGQQSISQFRHAFMLALRGGIDLFATRELRLGAYLEVMPSWFVGASQSVGGSSGLDDTSGQHGYIGLGFRGAYDFYRP